ncbi:MAG TPA: hypothetical protein VGD37_27280 [Kofleriaceae bacterium]|jgi:hypothetical protein
MSSAQHVSRPARAAACRLRRRLTWLGAASLGLAGPAHGAPSWSVGIDLHGTDDAFAARRPIGVAGAIRYGAVEGSVVADPMLFVLGWEMLDATLGRWFAGDRIELLGGWRQTSGELSGGRRYDEALLLGADAVAMSSPRFRIVFGAELATSLWRHGAGIPANTIALAFDADLATRVELGFHLRFEITGAL